MKTVLKWIGIIVGVVLLLVIGVVAAIYISSSLRMNKTYTVQVEPLEIPTGEEAIAWGEHVAIIRGCTDCHRPNLGGGTLIDVPIIGKISPSNLTSGQGSTTASFSDEDWVRAIRHGVAPDGKPLIFMPSHEFFLLSDTDLGSLIAYVKQVPPVDNTLPEHSAGPLGRVLFLSGQFDLVPAEKIDHSAARPTAPQPGVTAEYGEYMAMGCVGCHGPGYSGGPIPGVPPEWPPAKNITPGGNSANWSEEEFMHVMRTGYTPEEVQLAPEYMPWPSYAAMTDEELQALWLYLQSLPAKETGNR